MKMIVIPNARYLRLGLDETYLDDLADPTQPMDKESPSLGVPCCLAFLLLPLPVLGL